jgi:hypothetical protein
LSGIIVFLTEILLSFLRHAARVIVIKKCWQLRIFATQKLIFRLYFLRVLGFLVFRAIPEYFVSLLHEIINFRSLNSAALLLNLSVEIYCEFVFIRFVVVEIN